MANYPQQDDCSGVWKLKDVNNAVQGGYWRVGTGRALFSGGNDGSGSDGSNIIDFVTITTNGNAADFGDLTVARYDPVGASNGTRGIFSAGTDGTGNPTTVFNTIDYISISSTGNAIDFGDTVATIYTQGGVDDGSRGVFGGGRLSPGSNTDNIE